jgi:hypothetical protein
MRHYRTSYHWVSPCPASAVRITAFVMTINASRRYSFLAASGNIFTIGQMFNGNETFPFSHGATFESFAVAGRDGLMPHIFSMKHYQSNVPMIAIMCEIILSFVFLFFMSNIGKLIICVGMINWTCNYARLSRSSAIPMPLRLFKLGA